MGETQTTLEEAREIVDRNEPLPEAFYIDAQGEVQFKRRPQPTDHWAVELYERFISLSKECGRLLSGMSENNSFSRGSMHGRSRQAAECANDLYLWAPADVRRMIMERHQYD